MRIVVVALTGLVSTSTIEGLCCSEVRTCVQIDVIDRSRGAALERIHQERCDSLSAMFRNNVQPLAFCCRLDRWKGSQVNASDEFAALLRDDKAERSLLFQIMRDLLRRIPLHDLPLSVVRSSSATSDARSSCLARRTTTDCALDPGTIAHQGFCSCRSRDAVDVHGRAADHPVNVDEALIGAQF